MSRPKLSVDRDTLQKEISIVEKKESFDSLSALFAAVAARPYCQKIGATVSVITLRYQEFGLESKTKPGKRGRKAGAEKPAESVAPVVKELDGPGRGRKQCQECKKHVGVKCRLCVCGAEFTRSERPTVEPAARPAPARIEQPVNRPISANDDRPTIHDIRTFGYRKIYTPAGECPVKLTGYTPERVLPWMEAVIKYWEDKKQIIGYEGLAYYARMQFYDFDTNEYKQVESILREQFVREETGLGDYKRA